MTQKDREEMHPDMGTWSLRVVGGELTASFLLIFSEAEKSTLKFRGVAVSLPVALGDGFQGCLWNPHDGPSGIWRQ